MKKSVICDIDGVILHNNDLVPGADRFVVTVHPDGIDRKK